MICSHCHKIIMIHYEKAFWMDNNGKSHKAIIVLWDDVKHLLGRLHDGSADDDILLIDTLLANGAPRWTMYADIVTDKKGWYLLQPGA